jgi:hypothetical protein
MPGKSVPKRSGFLTWTQEVAVRAAARDFFARANPKLHEEQERRRRRRFRDLRAISRKLPYVELGRRISRYSRKGLCPRAADGRPDPTPILHEYEVAAKRQTRLDPRRWAPSWGPPDETRHLQVLAELSERLADLLHRRQWHEWRPAYQRAFLEDSLREAGFLKWQIPDLVEFLARRGHARKRQSLSDEAAAESWRLMNRYWAKRAAESLAHGESVQGFLEQLQGPERAEYRLLLLRRKRVDPERRMVRDARLFVKLSDDWRQILDSVPVRRRVFHVFVSRLRRLPPEQRGRSLARRIALERID